MAYIKKYKGERETGKMLDCIITRDDGTQVDLGQYPEMEKIYETVWEVDWLPEHMPVGSVVRYKLEHRKNEGVREAVVTGHWQNGVDSWVIKTDEPCSILGMQHKESFNASYVLEVVSRGNGTTRFENLGNGHHFKMDYLLQQSQLPANIKRPHLYAAGMSNTIVAYVLHNHPAFKDLIHDGHIYDYVASVSKRLEHLFTRVPGGGYFGYCTVNKKRLIKALKALLVRTRRPKAELRREEKEQQRLDYERDLRSFCEDAL